MCYRKLNNYTGWLVFAIATAVYLLTVEQTTSLWDCGEYIITANKLEVGHPPGAPLFMMLGRLFSAFASPENAAMMVNSMSALSSSFTILFLFWSITMLGRKLVLKSGEINKENTIVILGAGAVGALAYTFTDSFWFSAVEGEVYAMSSMFTAIVFWAILKWDVEDDDYTKAIEENNDFKGHPNRWLLFISYMIGLSIGVHLLNLLAIPAIVFVVYFKKYTFTWKSFFGAGILSLIILGGVQSFIIPNTIKYADAFERLFTNSLGLPFNTGAITFFVLLITLIVLGIKFATRKGKAVWYQIVMSIGVLLIGYSSFMMIIVRSNANPPLDENNPETLSQYYSYLKRDQYGDWPILKGPYFNSLRYSQVSPQSLPDDFKSNKENYLEPEKANYFKVLSIKPNPAFRIPRNKLYKIQSALNGLHLKLKFSEDKNGFILSQNEVTFINNWDLNKFLEKVKNLNESIKKAGINTALSFSKPSEKYININENQGRQYKYHPDELTLFPRMWRNAERTPQGYMYWAGYEQDDFTGLYFDEKDPKDLLPIKKQYYRYYKQQKNKFKNFKSQIGLIINNNNLSKEQKEKLIKPWNDSINLVRKEGKNILNQTYGIFTPSFVDNLTYLFNYQLGWMYGRYFMWNFAGRQNDVQGFGGTPEMGGNSLLEGNWISGLNFIDSERLGNQESLPLKISQNKGHNTYFYLPLILGLIGFFFQLWKHPKGWFTVFLLFLLTGIAIIFYLNQKPWEPRERDYAYAASFYAFAIWIGLGVYALYYAAKKMTFNELVPILKYGLGGSAIILVIQYALGSSLALGFSLVFLSFVSTFLLFLMYYIRKYVKKSLIYAVLAIAFGMAIPSILAFENWDDHDRSNRSTARDSAFNYLASCDYNAILFTNGDNDTFPLWYIQEVEGVRTDVRVANMSLLGTDWHINQMKKKAYESDPLPIKMPERLYRQGTRDAVYCKESAVNKNNNKYFSAKEAINTISKNVNNPGIDYNNLFIKVNKENAIKSGLVTLGQAGLKYDLKDIKVINNRASFERLINDSSCFPCDSLIDVGTTYFIESENNFYQVIEDDLNFKKEYQPSLWKGNKFFVIDDLESSIKWKLKPINNSYMTKADLAVLDILSNYDWDRPICFASTGGMGVNKNLAKYTQIEGLVHKLVPVEDKGEYNGFNIQKTYELLTGGYELKKPNSTEKVAFLWGNMSEPGVLVDDYSLNHVVALRYSAYRTSMVLLRKGDKEKAIEVLDNIFEKLPITNNQVPMKRGGAANALCSVYFQAGEIEKGNKVAKVLADFLISEINFYLNQNEKFAESFEYNWSIALKELNDLEQMSNPEYEKLINRYNTKINSLEAKLGFNDKVSQYEQIARFINANQNNPQAEELSFRALQLKEEIDSLSVVYKESSTAIEENFKDSLINLPSILVEPEQMKTILNSSNEVFIKRGAMNKKNIEKNLPDRYKYYWGLN